MATATPRLMGAEVKRKEDPRLVTGTSAYVGDVTVPGLHYVVFVRSPHAHARVRKIDTKAALKRPGVVRVVTGEDLRAHVQQLPLGGPSAEGGGGAKTEAGRKHFPLSIGRVRHVGEPVAAVIATSEAAAVDGAQEVVVDWDPLPAVGDLASAMGRSAPKLHEDAPGNVEHTTEIKQGDPDAAFKKANKVVKQRMISQRLSGIPMEPRATLAAPDPATGGVTVWASHQAPHVLRNDLATVLGVPQNLVRVIAPEVGGGVGVYKFTNVDLKSTCVFTNSTPVAAYRGAGRPEAAYYLERLVDVVAQELGKKPEEIRRKNFIPPSAFPYATPTGQRYDSGEYDRALTKALEIAGVEKLRGDQQSRVSRRDRPLLGIGMACYVEMCGFGPFESAVVRVEPGGDVTAFTGTSAHGQGHETTFAQIIADHLGVPFDRIVVRHGDTLNTPMGNGTGGSRSLAVGGSAILGATLKVQDKARRIAATMLEAAAEDVVLTDARYHVKGVPARAITLGAIAAKAYAECLPEGMEHGLEATEFFRPPQLVYPFGAHVAVMEIDRETGRVHVRDFVSVDDCGVRISPTLVAGQVHGGLAQGIAQALMEEVVYSPDGQLVTGSLMDYAVPHPEDLPSFKTDQTTTPTPFNPMGAKGIGEAATIGSTPAVVNAVVDALKPLGVKHLDMPLKPERIWVALQAKKPPQTKK